MIIAAAFIVIDIISAVSMARSFPIFTLLSLVCAVVCLPALIMPIVMLRVIAKGDGIYVETPKTDPMPVEQMIKDARSRYMFIVRRLFTSGSEIFELLKADGVELIEYHMDRIRAEALLTFAELNDAKLARNILRIKNYVCTEVEDVKNFGQASQGTQV